MRSNYIRDFKLFLKLCGKSRWKLWVHGAFSALIGGAGATICQAEALRRVVAFFIQEDGASLNTALLMVSLTLIIGCIIRPTLNYISVAIINRTLVDLRIRIFHHLAELPVSYFDATHSGDIITRVNQDINGFAQSCNAVFSLSSIVITIITIIPYAFILKWEIAAIILALGCVYFLITSYIVIPLREKLRNMRAELSNISIASLENISGLQTVKQYSLEGHFIERFEDLSNSVRLHEKSVSNINAIINFIGNFVVCSGEVIIAIIGLGFVFSGTLLASNLTALISISNKIINVLIGLSSLPVQLQQAFAGLDRIHELFDIEVEGDAPSIDKQSKFYGITARDVWFAYPLKSNSEIKYALKGVSLQIPKGSTVAFVGNNGSGKTTMLKILAGLYQPNSGNINYSGFANKNNSISEMRSCVAYVPQNISLFNDSIYENIKYGNPLADRLMIEHAAEKANASEFIVHQEDGYNTIVGDGGVQLSGGEMQRVAIARAIAKNAEVILMDEATSGLDDKSERLIEDSLKCLSDEQTVIIVTHKLEVALKTDCIFFFKDGEILSSGTHKQLLDICPEYKEMYSK